MHYLYKFSRNEQVLIRDLSYSIKIQMTYAHIEIKYTNYNKNHFPNFLQYILRYEAMKIMKKRKSIRRKIEYEKKGKSKR